MKYTEKNTTGYTIDNLNLSVINECLMGSVERIS